MGIGFYIVAPSSILLSQSNAAERSYLTIGLFSVHMLILQYLQDLVFRQLAALRSGKNKNSDNLSEKKYYPPEGSMFYWVSCPHYILEISIYLSCQLFITPKWIPFSHILFFTICNQLCCIWLNHNWYKNNFPEWASKRAMLIPYQHRSVKQIQHVDYISRQSLQDRPINTSDCLLVQPLPLRRPDLVRETRRYFGCIFSAIQKG
uniref:Polyprenal reductase n=1 Tax=Schistosoma haematobium TaxID=6185 RepID=A0A094ZTX8_SCHHA